MIFPLDAGKVVKLMTMCGMIGVSNAGGLGGGGIAVPVLIFLFNYTPKQATDIAYIVVFWGGLGNFLQNAQKPHPVKQTTLVNYQLALVSLPGIVYGAILGYIANKLCYDFLLMVAMLFVAGRALIKNINKLRSLEQKQKESLLVQKDNYQEPVTLQQELSLLEVFDQVKYFLLITFIGFSLILIKGGKKIDSVIGIVQCSWGYFVVLFVMGVIFYMLFVMIRKVQTIQNNYNEDDLVILNRNGRNGLLTGIIGGLIGIGGGMILTAEWLALGLHPQEVTATATYMVIFTGFITMFQVSLAGGYQLDSYMVFSGATLISSFVIANVVTRLVKALNKPTLTLYCLIAVLAISIVILVWSMIDNLIIDPHGMFQSSTIC